MLLCLTIMELKLNYGSQISSFSSNCFSSQTLEYSYLNLNFCLPASHITVHLFMPIVKKVRFLVKLCISHKVCEVKFHKGTWWILILSDKPLGPSGLAYGPVWYEGLGSLASLLYSVKLINLALEYYFTGHQSWAARLPIANSLWEGSREHSGMRTIVELQTALKAWRHWGGGKGLPHWVLLRKEKAQQK